MTTFFIPVIGTLWMVVLASVFERYLNVSFQKAMLIAIIYYAIKGAM